MKIDLHVHIAASDGELTYKELIDWAEKLNLKTIAITDHDAIDTVNPETSYKSGVLSLTFECLEKEEEGIGLEKKIEIK